jgi:uncharacterized alpha-E superfamily protein
MTPRGPLLLSRYAEALFWFARYMERVENLARVLDVTDTFVRHGADQSGWESVVRINADEKNFYKRYAAPNAQTVPQYYLLDRENPNSIASCLFSARENARTLRPLISTEMWGQLNVFHNKVRALSVADTQPSHLSGLCAFLKESCLTHAGITAATLYRDQGYSFYAIGKYIERGDQTSRLVDIKYHTLLPKVSDVGGALDISQWHALLRAASGYYAFRRVYPSEMTPALVAGFLLMNSAFPPAQFRLRPAQRPPGPGAARGTARRPARSAVRGHPGPRPARVPRLGAVAVHPAAQRHCRRLLAPPPHTIAKPGCMKKCFTEPRLPCRAALSAPMSTAWYSTPTR